MPVLDTVPLAVAVPQGQPGEGSSEKTALTAPICNLQPLQPLESPCWGRCLYCSCADAHAGAGYALKKVQPMGRTHSGAGLS